MSAGVFVSKVNIGHCFLFACFVCKAVLSCQCTKLIKKKAVYQSVSVKACGLACEGIVLCIYIYKCFFQV